MVRLLTFISLFSLALIFCASSDSLSRHSVVILQNRGEIIMDYSHKDSTYIYSIKTKDPITLRTLLMQGFHLQFIQDGLDTLAVRFPSAKDVSEMLTHHPGEVKAIVQENKERRPDIRPLIAALNTKDVIIGINDNDSIDCVKTHVMELNASNGTLFITFEIESKYLIGCLSSIILKSKPVEEMLQHDEFDSKGFKSLSDEKSPQPFGVGINRENMSTNKTIELTFYFKNE